MATESSVVFNVSGCGTSCFYSILLSSLPTYPNPTAQTYLIGISASAASTTAFIYPQTGIAAGPLKFCNTLWVSWAGGVISVGVGATPGMGSAIVSYTDPAATPVNYVAFSSSPSAVNYYVYVPGLRVFVTVCLRGWVGFRGCGRHRIVVVVVLLQ